MRFMMIVKASENSEKGVLPTNELISSMNKYNQELAKAGVLLDLDGLAPSSQGARVVFKGDKRSVVDGPFAETKELIAGFWVIQAKSLDEAVEWAKRAPNPHPDGAETHIEIRRVFELEDLGDVPAIQEARELGERLAKK
ncbi:MAG TPA: YciI family protein [Candidatus Eremiobacteraceae bacterium]|jgi:hypothetical protein